MSNPKLFAVGIEGQYRIEASEITAQSHDFLKVNGG